MNINAQSDTPFLQPWWYLGDRVAGRDNVALARGAHRRSRSRRVFLWLPRRYAPVLPVARRARLPAHLAAAAAVDRTRFPRLSAAAYSTGIGAAHELDRRRGRPRRGRDDRLERRQPVPRLGERVLEPERQARVRPRRADTLIAGAARAAPDRAAVDRVPARPDGQDRARAVRPRRSLGADRRDAGRRRTRDAGWSLYRVNGPLRTSTPITRLVRRHLDRRRTSTWPRHGACGGVLRVPVHSDPTLFPGVSQKIAVSGSTHAVRRLALPSTRRRRSSCRCSRTEASAASTSRSRRRATGRLPGLNNSDPRTLGMLATGFEYEPAPGA